MNILHIIFSAAKIKIVRVFTDCALTISLHQFNKVVIAILYNYLIE
jgi:hypothetical protein